MADFACSHLQHSKMKSLLQIANQFFELFGEYESPHNPNERCNFDFFLKQKHKIKIQKIKITQRACHCH